LAGAVPGQEQCWALALLRTKECGSSGWEITAAPIRQRQKQMDLALDVVPAVDGQLSSVQPVVYPGNPNLLGQICQNVCSLWCYRPDRAGHL